MSAVEGRPCQLTVCRGCCCGTRKKVPGVDHKAQLARLSAIDDHSGRTVPVRTSKCLGICFQANVVVVQPSQEGRAAGGKPVWLGRVTEDALVEAVDDWIFDGGPGVAPLPAVLADHVTSKDAKKPKKNKKPKHSKAAKKERHKAREKKRARAEKASGSGQRPDKDRAESKKPKKPKKPKKNKKDEKDKKARKKEKRARKAAAQA
ncbi:(2Fe-2S) ferredoxin domain-containing protein [Nocardiopsis sp. CT-R113]|uniref:(2Fe-2S) ferredoxin domain-containing protein n=1 Tax=Nocardiopsis codii TaxID=3065942 RepID=A0ABU7K9E9_9ACTN|nr:(2Fe-2S) ferredoxin domain-containing protein [Nocardiopsis sp. CT-R113]MEE2038876.1 (2Fe-2S) ferredoxin domain-containing protein [Nocardiopsis sp. CT-R113]